MSKENIVENKIISIASLPRKIYDVRFFPVDKDKPDEWYFKDDTHFIGGSALGCIRNKELRIYCPACSDSYSLKDGSDKQKALGVELKSKSMFYSVVSFLNDVGEMTKPVKIKYSYSIWDIFKGTADRLGSLSNPDTGYLFSISVAINPKGFTKHDGSKCNTYVGSGVKSTSPFPITKLDWKSLIPSFKEDIVTKLSVEDFSVAYENILKNMTNKGKSTRQAFLDKIVNIVDDDIGTNDTVEDNALPLSNSRVEEEDNDIPFDKPEPIKELPTNKEKVRSSIPSCHSSNSGAPGYDSNDEFCSTCNHLTTCKDGVAKLAEPILVENTTTTVKQNAKAKLEELKALKAKREKK